MRVEIKSSEIMYNFNTDYDFQDDSYAFILMPASGKSALQIYLSFSRAVMSAVHMDIDPSGMRINHDIRPISTRLSAEEVNDPAKLSQLVRDIAEHAGISFSSLHSYITSNLDEFMRQLVHEAQERQLGIRYRNSLNGTNGTGIYNWSEVVRVQKLPYILFAFFLGAFGVHKFYAGQIGMGIVYLVMCLASFLVIPALVLLVCTWWEIIVAMMQNSDRDGYIVLKKGFILTAP